MSADSCSSGESSPFVAPVDSEKPEKVGGNDHESYGGLECAAYIVLVIILLSVLLQYIIGGDGYDILGAMMVMSMAGGFGFAVSYLCSGGRR
jgi:hypothetical protein